MIQLKSVKKTYRNGGASVRALRGVDTEIEKGEFVAILGPSGSGKSTLMNILGCLDLPTSGSYILDGEDVSKLGQGRLYEIRNRKIGFVFQDFNLVAGLTALENVEMPLIFRGESVVRRRKHAQEVLQSVGMGHRMDHRPNQLSGGQRQRVAIARALITDPAVILADEPTGNLDSQSGKEVLNILRGLNDRGATVVLITHDQKVADQAGRKVTLSDGKIM